MRTMVILWLAILLGFSAPFSALADGRHFSRDRGYAAHYDRHAGRHFSRLEKDWCGQRHDRHDRRHLHQRIHRHGHERYGYARRPAVRIVYRDHFVVTPGWSFSLHLR